MMVVLAVLTVGLPVLFCTKNSEVKQQFVLNQTDHMTALYADDVRIYGYFFDFERVADVLATRGGMNLTSDWHNTDISPLFRPAFDACAGFRSNSTPGECVVANKFPKSPALRAPAGCADLAWLRGAPAVPAVFTWADVRAPDSRLAVFNGAVLNLTRALADDPAPEFAASALSPRTRRILRDAPASDATLALMASDESVRLAKCLVQTYTVGFIASEPAGCSATYGAQLFLIVFIVGVVAVKVAFAIFFSIASLITMNSRHKRHSSSAHEKTRGKRQKMQNTANRTTDDSANPNQGNLPFVILFVTCFSEGLNSIKATLDSLANTAYPDAQKLLFVVADGDVTGIDNDVRTPDIITGLMSFPSSDDIFEFDEIRNPSLRSYIAIAEGRKQHNMAKVYCGFYKSGAGSKVPMVAVIKCGNPEELVDSRTVIPGNRGKRDSQLILMNFLSRVLFSDRMTALDFDMLRKISIVAVNPAMYQLVLMIDADTEVEPNSLRHMVNAMQKDDKVMGLCGETRIKNKFASWVTMIQVYEYFLSHRLGKSFESSFGGVTCLPGCFCMYRIKMPKGPRGAWTMPVLANPDIVEEYSENMVDSLHKKNLLLLGEDRYLTTLMLRTFPKRKLIFVPKAICQTIVPSHFKVLLSQRRRWINSTVHNLLELAQMRDLCGIFCFSMRFVVLLDLISTAVLPATLPLLIFQLASGLISGTFTLLPIYILSASLFLPGVLMAVASLQLQYVAWMIIYVFSVPIWNFVLPLWAFWHFDDFTWGETQQNGSSSLTEVEAESLPAGVSRSVSVSGIDADFLPDTVLLKKPSDWEAERLGQLRERRSTAITRRTTGTSRKPRSSTTSVRNSIAISTNPPSSSARKIAYDSRQGSFATVSTSRRNRKSHLQVNSSGVARGPVLPGNILHESPEETASTMSYVGLDHSLDGDFLVAGSGKVAKDRGALESRAKSEDEESGTNRGSGSSGSKKSKILEERLRLNGSDLKLIHLPANNTALSSQIETLVNISDDNGHCRQQCAKVTFSDDCADRNNTRRLLTFSGK